MNGSINIVETAPINIKLIAVWKLKFEH
jgi:hypothetical protein